MIALLRMSAGLIVWAVAFCIVYGVHGIGCAAGWDRATIGPLTVQHAALGAVWAGCIAATIVVAWLLRPRGDTGLVAVTAWRVALTGIVATVVSGLPILAIPACV